MLEFILIIVVLIIAGFTVLPVAVGFIKGTATYFKHSWFVFAVLFASLALIHDIYIQIKRRYSQAYSMRINEIKNKIPSTGTLFAILLLFIILMSFFSLNK